MRVLRNGKPIAEIRLISDVLSSCKRREARPAAKRGRCWPADPPRVRRLMRVFFDSSAFAKRYVCEHGTGDVLHWCDEASELVLSVTAIPDLISAFFRLRREGRLSAQEYEQMKNDSLADLQDALVCDPAPDVVRLAINALETHPLRGMDAIHVAAALAATADVFVSAAVRHCEAAAKIGLSVVVP